MIELLYSSSLVTLLFSALLLMKFENSHFFNFLSRSTFMIASLMYLFAIFLFPDSTLHKASIVFRDLTLTAGFIMLFRTIREYNFMYGVSLLILFGIISNFGIDLLNNSFYKKEENARQVTLLPDSSLKKQMKRTKSHHSPKIE